MMQQEEVILVVRDQDAAFTGGDSQNVIIADVT
jgi:hypothetical protein